MEIKVWNMHTEEHVTLKQWMRWCPYIWTNHLKYTQEDWDKVPR